MIKKPLKYYSCLEQHKNGSWWYHMKTFRHAVEAIGWCHNFLRWRDSVQTVIEHDEPLPQETLWTTDFENFCPVGDSRPAATIKASQIFTKTFKKSENA